MVPMYGVLKPFYDTCCGLEDIQVSVEGVLDQVRRFFLSIFLRKIYMKLEPTMLQHSFWALWTRIFKPNNLLYYYLALMLTLECDLDGLENGASENHVMIIPGVNK